MQKNDLALKRKILIDGEELPGLVETSDLMDEEGVVEVPSFGRMHEIKNGVKKFAPIDATYKVERTSLTYKKYYSWFRDNEYHDVTIINTDATGAEMDRWILRDCEISRFDERRYNAAQVEYFGFAVKIHATSDPVKIDAA